MGKTSWTLDSSRKEVTILPLIQVILNLIEYYLYSFFSIFVIVYFNFIVFFIKL